MNGYRRIALTAALLLGAAACGSTTGPEDDLSRLLPVIDESTIAVPDSVQLAVPFNVDFVLGCPAIFDVVFDLEYYAGAEVVILPSCIGDVDELAGTQDERSPSRAARVEVHFEDSVGAELPAVTVRLVGANGTFERTARVVENQGA